MIAFIVVGGIGLVLLVLSMLIGEFLDFDLGDSSVSGTALGAGLTVFGAVGALVVTNGLPTWLAYVGSAVGAVIVVFLIQRLVRHLRDTEDGVPQSVVGAKGTATSDIDTNRGEVSLDVAQELERRLAWSQEPIPEGSRIVVLEQSGSRVQVQQYFPND